MLSIGCAYGIGLEVGKQQGDSGVTLSRTSVTTIDPIRTQEMKAITGIPAAEESSNEVAQKGRYVGSKNGTKYYTPGCPGTNRIKPENYIWFETVEDATLQGYSKGSC